MIGCGRAWTRGIYSEGYLDFHMGIVGTTVKVAPPNLRPIPCQLFSGF
jgi:hypothetical protein